MKLSLAAATMLVMVSALGHKTTRTVQTQDLRPNYAGRWTYNDSLSDHPRDQLGADSSGGGEQRRGGGRRGGGSDGGRRGGGGGMGGGRGGFGGEGGGGGGGMDPGQRAAMRMTMELVTSTPIVVDIAQVDTAFTFTADGGAALVLPANGHEIKEKPDGETEVKIKGKWQGVRFTVERKVSSGGTVTEEYVKSSDGKQLYIIVKAEGLRGRTIQFRRIYDWTPQS
jgi:hypothetical protein